jgi:hypothetical protein
MEIFEEEVSNLRDLKESLREVLPTQNFAVCKMFKLNFSTEYYSSDEEESHHNESPPRPVSIVTMDECSSSISLDFVSSSDVEDPSPSRSKSSDEEEESQHGVPVVVAPRLPPISQGFMCIAIGDIEGQVARVETIVKFIRRHPHLQFVFIGDIFRQLRANTDEERRHGLECIRLLSEFFDPCDYQGPEDFESLELSPGEFDTGKHVQFIAGNHEIRVLRWLRCPEARTEVDPRWFHYRTDDPKLSFLFRNDELHEIYKYFNSMKSELVYRYSREDQGRLFVRFIRFRHARHCYWNYETDKEEAIAFQDQGNESTLIVCGHSHEVGHCMTARGDVVRLLELDASENNRDHRVGVVGFQSGDAITWLADLQNLDPPPLKWQMKQKKYRAQQLENEAGWRREVDAVKQWQKDIERDRKKPENAAKKIMKKHKKVLEKRRHEDSSLRRGERRRV